MSYFPEPCTYSKNKIKVELDLCLRMPGPILAVYCVRLSHAITCPFSKYFQILYIFAQISKYFTAFQHFFVLFFQNCTHAIAF